MERHKFRHIGVLPSEFRGHIQLISYMPRMISSSGSRLSFVERFDEAAAHPQFKVVINSVLH